MRVRSSALAAAFALLSMTVAHADIHVFTIELTGAEEVPPVTTAATCTITVTVDDVANTVTASGSYSGMSGDVFGAHIHGQAPVGTNSGVLVGLNHTGGMDGSILPPNNVNVPASTVNTILSGLAYLNVHSTMFNSGELRGQIRRVPADFCNGDGGDQAGCTDCPCNNNTAPGTIGGCMNSSGNGARLRALRLQSVSVDTLRMEVINANPNTFGVLASADNALPNMGPCPMGSGVSGNTLDGLRCIGGNLLRHGARPTDSIGAIGFFTNGWGPPNGPPGGISGNGGFVAGQTRHFMVFYREFDTAQCMTGQNTTQGVTVEFIP